MPKEAKKPVVKASKKVVEEGEKKKRAPKKEKKEKDPNAPKRPLSAYMYFVKDQMDPTKKENPTAKFGELGKILGEKWRSLDANDKKVYTDKAAKDKKRYEGAKAEYEKAGPPAASAEEEVSAEESEEE